MNRMIRPLAVLAAATLLVSACGTAASPSPSSPAASEPAASATIPAPPSIDTTPVTIRVWDYYGETTPIKPALDGFRKAYPWITVDYQALDWDSMNEKFNVGVASGEAPDVATIDMTWIPTLAAHGYLEDLTALSGGQLNEAPIESQYTKGAVEAMTFDGHFVTMLFDFDTYALYYRSDLFENKGIAVPKTWDELRDAAAKLAEDTNGDGKPDKYRYAIRPNSFHFSQFLFQEGGSILSADNTKAAFNSDAGLAGLDFQKKLLDDGSGLYWADSEGDLTPAIVDERVGMFSDGPYYMGLLKSGAPVQAGKWKVALEPFTKQPGSYLGGTGLGIPSNAAHKAAGWLFIQYMLKPENEVGVFTYAGAAPATTAALQAPELNQPDPYFGGDAPFKVFLEAMSTASHFPYVGQWNDIDAALGEALDAALLGQTAPKEALDNAATEVDDLLAK